MAGIYANDGSMNVTVVDGNLDVTIDTTGLATDTGQTATTTAITDISKAEDAAHSSGDKGVMALAVRNDAGTVLAGTDGDYIPLNTDSAGSIRTAITSIQPGTGATNLGKAIDSAVGGTDTGVASLAKRVDTPAALTPANGDYTPLEVDANGRLHVITTLAATQTLTTVTTVGTVSSVSAVIAGTGATNLGKAEDAAHTTGDTGVAVWAVQKAIPVDLAADGDYAAFEVSKGRLHVLDKSSYADQYETVAASQTAQAMGATGATGDYIRGIWVVPASTSPGSVLLLDNATSITVFAGGASSLSNLAPFFIPLGLTSVSGAWKITTGASISCIGMGIFT